MALRDAEALVLGLLAGIGPDASVKVPLPRPDEFLWVRRTGGPVRGRVVDYPQITVTVWAGSSTRAGDLAREARQVLMDSALGTNGIHAVEAASMYYDPDPDSGADRYTFTVFMTVRGTRS